MDFHISVIYDIKKIFEELGHTVQDVTLSDHAFVIGRKKNFINGISDWGWTNYFNPWFPEGFSSQHKELENFDGFISTYPPIFSLLYLGFKKPSFMHIPIRFDYGIHSNPKAMEKYISTIQKKVISNNLLVTANNKYDTMYFQFLTGIIPEHIPSLCNYTLLQYNKEHHSEDVLLYADNKLDMSKIKFKYKLKNNIPQGYDWKELLKFKAIIHFPYQISTMSIFEQYTANIPLFFPSKKLLNNLYFNNQGVLSQVSNYQLWKNLPKTIISFHGELDLNDYTNPDIIMKWLEYADYYDTEWMPHIQYFDSFEELNDKINISDFQKISSNMQQANIIRKQKIYSKWKDKLNEIHSRF
jgi:hypothetical protein